MLPEESRMKTTLFDFIDSLDDTATASLAAIATGSATGAAGLTSGSAVLAFESAGWAGWTGWAGWAGWAGLLTGFAPVAPAEHPNKAQDMAAISTRNAALLIICLPDRLFSNE